MADKTTRAADQTIQHYHVPGHGSVTVEVERNSRGVNWRLAIQAPREAGDSFDDVFARAIEHVTRAGLTLNRVAAGLSEQPS